MCSFHNKIICGPYQMNASAFCLEHAPNKLPVGMVMVAKRGWCHLDRVRCPPRDSDRAM
jgi:hypothetical protein